MTRTTFTGADLVELVSATLQAVGPTVLAARPASPQALADELDPGDDADFEMPANALRKLLVQALREEPHHPRLSIIIGGKSDDNFGRHGRQE